MTKEETKKSASMGLNPDILSNKYRRYHLKSSKSPEIHINALTCCS